ncbi:MAG: folate-binding protein YgfZ [Gammaproteobacteria bacterium]|nr:folate-binding protein YgfZ [Gammaproteobacteria bacterium]
MKQEWLEFLEQAGAEIDNNKVNHFGNPDSELRVLHTGLVMADLSHLGLISAYGDDAATFLQGQLTNDIKLVDLQHSQLSACCTPKGRILSNFRIFKRQETLYLRLPQEQLESSLKRLQMFILMSKVTMEDSTDSLVHIGLSGPDADQHLQQFIPEIPELVDGVSQCNDYTVIKLAGPHPRFEIYGELEPMSKLWQHLDVHAALVGADAWSMLDVLAGIPTIYPETSEAFVPQMINMQVINGVSFKKGCYTGQEVVARMQYLGKLKRHMFRVHIDTHVPVKPGDALYAAGSTSGQGTGTIVEAKLVPDDGYEGLAVINISDAEQSGLKLIDENGPAITIKPLPYSLEP